MQYFHASGLAVPIPSKRLFFNAICFMLFSSVALAQSRGLPGAADGQREIIPLQIGDTVPQEFWTREHLFYINGDTVRKSLDGYRGVDPIYGPTFLRDDAAAVISLVLSNISSK